MTMIADRSVTMRASVIANRLASVPELVNRTR